LNAFIRILSPVAWLFVKLQLVVSRLGGRDGIQPSVTEQELMNIIETIEEEGVIDEQQSELMQSAMEFDETTAQEILTPRVDLVAISLDDPPEKIRSIVIGERYSRMPVYRDSIDNIVGVLHTRDYLESALAGQDSVDIEQLLSKPLFVHKTRRISTLLTQFRRDRVHMAVVIDDYGGTMGIVTMEDVLEELVGDIWDEDEEAEIEFLQSERGIHCFG
jgi:CBS domain containing-hemolysin-like protein